MPAVAHPPRIPFDRAGKPVAVIVFPEVPMKLTVACDPRVKAPRFNVTLLPEAPTLPQVLALTVVPLNAWETAPLLLPLAMSAPHWPVKFRADDELTMLFAGAPAALKSSAGYDAASG